MSTKGTPYHIFYCCYLNFIEMPDYTLYSGVHVCWSEHSDSSFAYGFMSLDYGLGTMTATTFIILGNTEFIWLFLLIMEK